MFLLITSSDLNRKEALLIRAGLCGFLPEWVSGGPCIHTLVVIGTVYSYVRGRAVRSKWQGDLTVTLHRNMAALLEKWVLTSS